MNKDKSNNNWQLAMKKLIAGTEQIYNSDK